MYSKWPYPSRLAGKDLTYDLVNLIRLLLPTETLRDIDVLDAGCGSGHRLVAFAKRFPEAQFTGIDISEESLEVGRQLAFQHGVKNIRFLYQDLLDLDLSDAFDIITSTGVVHHLETQRLVSPTYANCFRQTASSVSGSTIPSGSSNGLTRASS